MFTYSWYAYFFHPEYPMLSDWNSLFTFTQKEASCLYVGKPPTHGCVAYGSDQIYV